MNDTCQCPTCENDNPIAAAVCDTCEKSTCNECTHNCAICGENACCTHTTECPDCRREICPNCISADAATCDDCAMTVNDKDETDGKAGIENLPYRIDRADLRLIPQTGDPYIRLDLMRGCLHVGLNLPVDRLASLCHVAGIDHEDAALSDTIGQPVMVGFDGERAVELSNLYEPHVRFRVRK